MSTDTLPHWLYRSEAFAEDLEPAAPVLTVPGSRSTWRPKGQASALVMLPAIVALASTVAAVVGRPA